MTVRVMKNWSCFYSVVVLQKPQDSLPAQLLHQYLRGLRTGSVVTHAIIVPVVVNSNGIFLSNGRGRRGHMMIAVTRILEMFVSRVLGIQSARYGERGVPW